MQSSRQIKRRLSAASNISKITKAMEMVSASKMKRAQNQALQARAYALALHESLQKLSAHANPSLHPLLSTHQTGLNILLVISTNKGLCGSLNTQLLKESLSYKKTVEVKDSEPLLEIIAIGKKAVHFANLFNLKIHAQFTDLPENIQSSDLVAISDLIISNFLNHNFKSVSILYTDFINTLSQRPKLIKLLPLQADLQEQVREDIDQEKIKSKAEYLFEPDPKSILKSLLPFYIENTLYQAFLESRASEHSARMVTMKNASENASELMTELKLQFNKSRQAAITSELLDISTAALTV